MVPTEEHIRVNKSPGSGWHPGRLRKPSQPPVELGRATWNCGHPRRMLWRKGHSMLWGDCLSTLHQESRHYCSNSWGTWWVETFNLHHPVGMENQVKLSCCLLAVFGKLEELRQRNRCPSLKGIVSNTPKPLLAQQKRCRSLNGHGLVLRGNGIQALEPRVRLQEAGVLTLMI